MTEADKAVQIRIFEEVIQQVVAELQAQNLLGLPRLHIKLFGIHTRFMSQLQ
jgi:hypothetical protein